jgi:hypothetical protein
MLALVGVPYFRQLPAAPILFFLSAISGALVARGGAYPGRFSIHVIGSACAVATCTVAAFASDSWRRAITPTRQSLAENPAAR